MSSLADKVGELKQRLEAEKQELLKALRSEPKGEGEGLEAFSTSPADSNWDTVMLQKPVLDCLKVRLRRVESALRKILDGTYGVCEDCGEAIPPERLEALPDATRCLECERRRLRHHR